MLKINDIQYVGLDYSINKFAICAINNKGNIIFLYNVIKIDYREKKVDKSRIEVYKIVNGVKELVKTIQMANSKNLAHFFEKAEIFSNEVIGFIELCENPKIMLEGYSRGSFGRADDTREFTGILKYKLNMRKIYSDYKLLPPQSLKKVFTGIGNCDEYLMAETAKNKLGYYLPNDDTVDAYALAVSCKNIIFTK